MGLATLEEIFETLKEQVKNGECRKSGNGICYADKILKIAGLKNLTVKVSYGSDGHYFLSFYRGARITRQFIIYADDAGDFIAIASFLKKYGDTINKYVVRGSRTRDNSREVEVDLGEEQSEEKSSEEQEEQSSSKKSSTKSTKSKKTNIEDEF